MLFVAVPITSSSGWSFVIVVMTWYVTLPRSKVLRSPRGVGAARPSHGPSPHAPAGPEAAARAPRLRGGATTRNPCGRLRCTCWRGTGGPGIYVSALTRYAAAAGNCIREGDALDGLDGHLVGVEQEVPRHLDPDRRGLDDQGGAAPPEAHTLGGRYVQLPGSGPRYAMPPTGRAPVGLRQDPCPFFSNSLTLVIFLEPLPIMQRSPSRYGGCSTHLEARSSPLIEDWHDGRTVATEAPVGAAVADPSHDGRGRARSERQADGPRVRGRQRGGRGPPSPHLPSSHG